MLHKIRQLPRIQTPAHPRLLNPSQPASNNVVGCEGFRAYTERVDRRGFVAGMLGTTVLALAGCAQPKPETIALPPVVRAPIVPATAVSPIHNIDKIPLPPGPVYQIPGQGNLMAWTLDDGASRECIEAYLDFAEETGNRLTFFVTSSYPAWGEVASRMAPMIQSGQIQMANHTHRHSSLKKLSDAALQQDMMQCHQFIADTFGVDARPFYRPPYGDRDGRTDAAAAAIGYTSPMMWYGTLGDASERSPEQVLAHANQWFQPQRIVIGHVNHVGGVTDVFPQLQQLVSDRGLLTVTLNDVFVY